MRYNIVKSQLEAFIIRPISAVFQPGYTNASVIIRARDSFQPGHIPDNRIDAAGPWRVCAVAFARACSGGAYPRSAQLGTRGAFEAFIARRW